MISASARSKQRGQMPWLTRSGGVTSGYWSVCGSLIKSLHHAHTIITAALRKMPRIGPARDHTGEIDGRGETPGQETVQSPGRRYRTQKAQGASVQPVTTSPSGQPGPNAVIRQYHP